jgi:hypothetical protein
MPFFCNWTDPRCDPKRCGTLRFRKAQDSFKLCFDAHRLMWLHIPDLIMVLVCWPDILWMWVTLATNRCKPLPFLLSFRPPPPLLVCLLRCRCRPRPLLVNKY